MAQRARRRNASVLGYGRALLIAVFTWYGLAATHVHPTWLGPLLGLVAGSLMLVSADLGVLAAVVVLSIPVIAVSPLVGISILLLSIVAVRYLASDNAAVFLLIVVALLGAQFGPVWVAVALAGYLLGPSEGALAATIACITLEIAGLVLGKPAMGITLTGGTAAMANIAAVPPNFLAGGWIAASAHSLSAESVNELVSNVSRVARPAALILQPLIWGAGALVAGLVKRSAKGERAEWIRVGSVAAGIGVAAVGTIAIYAFVGVTMPMTPWLLATISSLVVASAFVVVLERFFPLQMTAASRKVSMASEDADVDELLRLIATAEDKLASQHTSQRVVLITDMKSFSRMTEEDGSVATAKAIQRHRDLLLPIVTRHHGAGKSTGGDGLVAAFERADDALNAAVDMQSALAGHNIAHPNEREMWVRAGLASGEVVLDNGGRPFIGAGLNLAARVMNLADGGQILATGDVASAAQSAGVTVHYYGKVELKNIAKPVEIAEVIWAADQIPHDPRIPVEVDE